MGRAIVTDCLAAAALLLLTAGGDSTTRILAKPAGAVSPENETVTFRVIGLMKTQSGAT